MSEKITKEKRLELKRRFGIEGPIDEPPELTPEQAKRRDLLMRYNIPDHGQAMPTEGQERTEQDGESETGEPADSEGA